MCCTALIWTLILLTLGNNISLQSFNWPKPVYYFPIDKINASVRNLTLAFAFDEFLSASSHHHGTACTQFLKDWRMNVVWSMCFVHVQLQEFIHDCVFISDKSNAHDTLAGNARQKLARVMRRWKLANVTCFPALVFSSCGNLARYSAMLYSTLESGINGALWLVSFVDLLVCKYML